MKKRGKTMYHEISSFKYINHFEETPTTLDHEMTVDIVIQLSGNSVIITIVASKSSEFSCYTRIIYSHQGFTAGRIHRIDLSGQALHP